MTSIRKPRQQHLDDAAAYKAAGMQYQQQAIRLVALGDALGAAHMTKCAVWALSESVRCLNYADGDYSQFCHSSPPRYEEPKPKKKKK